MPPDPGVDESVPLHPFVTMESPVPEPPDRSGGSGLEDGRVRVTGVVVDKEGEPVAGAEVVGPSGMRHHQYGWCLWSATTDARGRFADEFDAAPYKAARSHRLPTYASAGGFVTARLEPTSEEREMIGRGGVLPEMRFVLRRSADLQLMVLDRDGRAVPHVKIAVGRRLGTSEEVHEDMVTNSQGRCWVTGIDPEDPLEFRAEAFGVVSDVLDLRGLLKGGETLCRDLVLWPVSTARLRVVAAGDAEGARLFVDDAEDPGDYPDDKDGPGWLVAVRPGRRHVVACDAEGTVWFRDTVEAAEGEETRIDVEFPRKPVPEPEQVAGD